MTVTTFPYEIARRKRLDDLIKRAFSHVWSRGLGRPPLGPAVSAAGAVLILHDQFTDADGTLLTAHTIAPVNTPGATWTQFGGLTIATIYSNQVGIPIGTTSTRAGYVEAGISNAEITSQVMSDLATASAAVAIHYLRIIDTSNYWAIQANWYDGTISIFEKTGVNPITLRASSSVSLLTNVWYEAKSIVNEQSIKFTLNNVEVSYSSTTHITGTKYGLATQRGATRNLYQDDFKIYAL